MPTLIRRIGLHSIAGISAFSSLCSSCRGSSPNRSVCATHCTSTPHTVRVLLCLLAALRSRKASHPPVFVRTCAVVVPHVLRAHVSTVWCQVAVLFTPNFRRCLTNQVRPQLSVARSGSPWVTGPHRTVPSVLGLLANRNNNGQRHVKRTPSRS